MAYFRRTTKPKNTCNLTEGELLNAGRKKNECRNERCPVGAESELLGRAELQKPKFVRLADQSGGFVDDETKFHIVRDQVQSLGETVGRRTMQAIQSGGLLIVDAPKPTKKKDEAK